MSRHTLVPIALLVLGACATDSPLVPPTAPVLHDATVAHRPLNPHRVSEAVLQGISADLPSFGGYYLDRLGHLVAYVTDTSEMSDGRRAVERATLDVRFSGRNGAYRPAILMRRGEYRFTDLAAWRELVTDSILSKVPGVISDEIDLKDNRLGIGVARNDAGAQSDAERILERLGIPAAVIEFQQSEIVTTSRLLPQSSPTSLFDHVNRRSRVLYASAKRRQLSGATLSDPSDPFVGGVWIPPEGCTGTIGLDYTVSGVTKRYVMTASHCTRAWAQVTGDTLKPGGGGLVVGCRDD